MRAKRKSGRAWLPGYADEAVMRAYRIAATVVGLLDANPPPTTGMPLFTTRRST